MPDETGRQPTRETNDPQSARQWAPYDDFIGDDRGLHLRLLVGGDDAVRFEQPTPEHDRTLPCQ
jgi:hypothetical protein